jgi:chromosome transmission fidelity protein 18
MHKVAILRENSLRQARYKAGNPHEAEDFSFESKDNAKPKGPVLPIIPVKKDFFGRVIKSDPKPLQETDGNSNKRPKPSDKLGQGEQKVWVTFHEGMNNAVRKPISLNELLQGL